MVVAVGAGLGGSPAAAAGLTASTTLLHPSPSVSDFTRATSLEYNSAASHVSSSVTNNNNSNMYAQQQQRYSAPPSASRGASVEYAQGGGGLGVGPVHLRATSAPEEGARQAVIGLGQHSIMLEHGRSDILVLSHSQWEMISGRLDQLTSRVQRLEESLASDMRRVLSLLLQQKGEDAAISATPTTSMCPTCPEDAKLIPELTDYDILTPAYPDPTQKSRIGFQRSVSEPKPISERRMHSQTLHRFASFNRTFDMDRGLPPLPPVPAEGALLPCSSTAATIAAAIALSCAVDSAAMAELDEQQPDPPPQQQQHGVPEERQAPIAKLESLDELDLETPLSSPEKSIP